MQKELVTLIQFSEEEKSRIVETAKARYYSNRNAKNPTATMFPGKRKPYFADMIGAAGELAVAKMLETPWANSFYEQDEFNRIKNTIKDVGNVEVRATEHATGRLILNDKDLVHKADVPFIFVVIHIDKRADGTVDVVAEVKGWITAREGIEKGAYWKGKYGVPAYYISADLLKPVSKLTITVDEKSI